MGGGSKSRGIFGGVSIIRIVVFGGLYWRPPYVGKTTILAPLHSPKNTQSLYSCKHQYPPQNYHGIPYDPFFNKTVVFMGPVLGCMFIGGLSND